MTWTYSGDPSTSDLDAVRFMIQDTVQEDPLLQNEEISFLLTETGSVRSAAVRAAQTIAAKFARLADFTLGDYSANYSQRAQQYTQIARELSAKSAVLAAPFAGGITRSQKEAVRQNSNRVDPKFTRDIMKNRRRGPDPGVEPPC